MVDYTLCTNDKCQYRETCKRWLDKPGGSPDDLRQSYAHLEWKRDRCHMPVDGRKL